MPVRANPVLAGPAPVRHEGSLWSEDGFLNDLFVDLKARRVGDIVTVKVVESSKATNKATTQTGRNSSLQAGIDQLFGIEDWWQNDILPDIGGDWPKVNPFGSTSVKGSMQSAFDGSGTTTRSGNLTAFITARITEILPGGNFRIVGSREVVVNHESQMIILSGTIRPRDISPDNVILSTFISEAQIAYSGTGIIDDRQRPGWLANLLNTIWPF
ncbi:MAG: flagellar basal body L-ring protein FlgH [Desulfobacterales bacterium]|nr:MAG: flagellar basal body L-ring protein FlgH [Desulfobacterales bacterium]